MLSTLSYKTKYGEYTQNTQTSNLTSGLDIINDSIRQIYAKYQWNFLEKQYTTTTVGGTQFYQLPNDYEKLFDVQVSIGNYQTQPKEAPSWEVWDNLNSTTTIQSNYPVAFFINGKTLGFYPTPSAAQSFTISYKARHTDLSITDYTTGFIISTTNLSTAITGTGTAWHSGMVGRYIQIAQVDSATTGDGAWYQIATVPTATTLTLTKAYQGTTMGGSVAYTIAQVPILPEEFQYLPLYDAVSKYWLINGEPERRNYFKGLYTELFSAMESSLGNKTSSPMLEDFSDTRYQNPNNYVVGI